MSLRVSEAVRIVLDLMQILSICIATPDQPISAKRSATIEDDRPHFRSGINALEVAADRMELNRARYERHLFRLCGNNSGVWTHINPEG